MIGLLAAVLAGLGVHYLYTAIVLRWPGWSLGASQRPDPSRRDPSRREFADRTTGRLRGRALAWFGMAEGDLRIRDIVVTTVALFVLSTATVFVIFGAIAPAAVVGAFAATFPVAAVRRHERSRRLAAQDAWPRMLEELRIMTGSLGRSIPQALFAVGRRAPAAMTDAFAAAQREWVISTDFTRTVAVLKRGLSDPTADVVCETLLVAHALGGNDLDRRLAALIEDRIQDTQGRKDARARQAGARFSRRFVLAVPFGMAVAGMSVGNGRAAYASSRGQALTVLAVGIVIACWVWSGRILRLPEEDRVFTR